eukprot:g7927.t1
MPPDLEDASAVHAQRVVRGFLGRLAALRQANLVYEKIFDPRTHAYYYYNTYTFQTTWTPPTVVTRILGEFGDLDTIAPTYGEEEAAVMLQAAWRRRRSVRMTRALLASVVSKILDETSGAHYYFNSLTGDTSWSKPSLFGSEDVENYLPRELLTDGQQGADPFGTASYGYDESQGWEGQEAWTEEQQDHRQTEEAGSGTKEEAGYDGWVWDDTSGWYYDEDLAAQLAAGTAALPSSITKTAADHDSTSGGGGDSSSGSDSDSDSDSSSGLDGATDAGDEEAVERRKRRRKRRRRSLPPRNYPRSKAQRLVDEVEDSVDGARPEVLDLSGLDMDRVTSRIYRFDWLQRLDLSRNRLYRISPDLAGMENLMDVDLRHNRIQAIPDDLEALTKLKHLRLSNNRISGFRGNIYLISSLETLDLGHNRLKEVPLQVGDLQLLKRTREWEIGLRLLRELVTLDVSYNRLKLWPPQVEECKNLRDLRLDHNKLEEVPDVVGGITALTNLDLSGNNLKVLPGTINSLSELIHLNLSDNKLRTLPILPVGRKERGPRLALVETLRLEHNRLTEGPAAVETFTTLTDLNVSHNPIKAWTLDVSGLRKMRHLRLKGVGLDQCPEGIARLNKLETLELSDNRIDALEQSTASLFKLKKLDLSGNNIPDLGSCVSSMVSLMYLDASGNGLERISPELSRCHALEFLDLSKGTVDSLPDGFSKLTNLRILRAQDNHLKSFPAEFEKLTALEELRLSGNRLRSLPTSLETLKKMRFAELSRNAIESPPEVTRRWPVLTHLVLSRNPLNGRRLESLRLLQAAQRGHDAMHRGEWKEAARFLEVAASSYNDAVHVVPDFPDPGGGEGPSLAKTRPHDMDSFHHVNLGLAHLRAGREASAEVEEMKRAEGLADEGSTTGSLSVRSIDITEDSSMVTVSTGEREARRQREVQLLALWDKRNQHFRAASAAYSYADRLEQLSRPVGRSAGVWLGRAAVAADMGAHAAALDDLEFALVQLRKNAKVRALLAKSRIELGQYERGLTDCGVASRLLDIEERLLGEREEEQKRKEAEAAEQAAKAESIRKAEERLAMRQRQVVEQAVEQEKEAQSLAEKANKVEEEAGELATASPTTSTPPTKIIATHSDKTFPDAVSAEMAGTPAATAKPRADNTTPNTSGKDDNHGTNGEQIEAADAGDVATTAKEKRGVEERELTTIVEETTETPGGHGSGATPGETKGEYGDDQEEEKDLQGREGAGEQGEEKEHTNDPSNPSLTVNQPPAAGSAGNEALQETSEEAPHDVDTAAKILGEVALGRSRDDSTSGTSSASGSDWGGIVGKSSRTKSVGDNPARAELTKQREDIALLVEQAKEGMVYIKQSVDMADVRRGFVFTRHGIPVRDTAVGQELMREGRSTRRERHRRLVAVEAAKKRQRARDVALMERAFRQVTARQESGRAAKAKKAAAMAMYRNIEEAWERQQEEKESKKRIEAAKRKIELEVLAAAEEAAFSVLERGGAQATPDALAESTVPAAATTTVAAAAEPSKAEPGKKTLQKREERGDEDEDEDDGDDPELQKVLARRAGGGGKKAARRRR